MRPFLLGILLGAFLVVLGGLPAPAPAACIGCAVLTHPSVGCSEAVQGGYICP